MLRLKRIRFVTIILVAVFSITTGLFLTTNARAADVPTFTLSKGERITAKGGWIDSDLFNSSGQFAGNNSSQLVSDGYLNLSSKELYFKPLANSSNVYVTHYDGFLSTTAQFRDSDNKTPCYIAIEVVASSGAWVGVNKTTNQKTDGCTKSINNTVGLYTDPKSSVNIVENAVTNTNASFRGIEVPVCYGTTDGTCLTNREKGINQIENLTCNTSTSQGVADCEEKTRMAACLNMSLSISVSSCMGKDVATQITSGNFDSITADTTDGQIERTCNTLKTNAEKAKCTEDAKKQRDTLKEKAACSGGKVWNEETGKCDSTGESCTAGALGWIMCPLVNVFGDIINWAASVLDSMLFISPIGSSTELQDVWRTFVGFANLILIIAFLVVIFSQATSVGLSAYGIKKMLPRIIAAAILINISYFICTIALDITNILGKSAAGIIHSVMPASVTSAGGEAMTSDQSWGDWLIVLLAGGIAAGIAVALGAIAFLVPILLSAALAIIAVFLIIAFRQMIIILLVILAPLAFAAMILPNTEQLFTKWRKLFTNMLIMYPVVMFLLYGSQLVGALLLKAKTVTGSAEANNWMVDIVATLVMTIGPFAGLYMYLKNSNKLMSMASGAVNKLGAGRVKATQGWAGRRHNERKQLLENRKENRVAQRMNKWGANDLRTRAQASLSPIGRRIGRMERNRQADEAGKLAVARMAAISSQRSGDPMVKARAQAALSELDMKEAQTQLAYRFNNNGTAAFNEGKRTGNQALMNAGASRMITTAKLEDLQNGMGSLTSKQIASIATHVGDKNFQEIKSQDLGMMYALEDMQDETKASTALGDLVNGTNAMGKAAGKTYYERAAGAARGAKAGQEKWSLARTINRGAMKPYEAAAMIADKTIMTNIKEDQEILLRNLSAQAGNLSFQLPVSGGGTVAATPADITTQVTGNPSGWGAFGDKDVMKAIKLASDQMIAVPAGTPAYADAVSLQAIAEAEARTRRLIV